MSYVHLMPLFTDYSQKFKELDSLDLRIVAAMFRHGVSNLSSLVDVVGVPQQTISYHVRRFSKRDLVRFRALIDEAKLGLESYSVIASTPAGKEGISSRAMTCFPLWRYLAIVDGGTHGNFARYVIPTGAVRELKDFLSELRKRRLILDFEMIPTASPNYPLLNLSFYRERKGTLAFDWNKWVTDYDSFPEAEMIRSTRRETVKFDLYDLIILRCLEINAMTTQRGIAKEMENILGNKQYRKYIPLVSRRLRDIIKNRGLVRGYRAYLFPNPGPTALFVMFYLVFSDSSSLKKFVAGLALLPYNTSYEKALKKDALFVRFIIPIHEWSNMRTSFTRLGEKGYLRNIRLFLGDLTHATWDNVEIYKMFKDGKWSFSFKTVVGMLEKTLSRK